VKIKYIEKQKGDIGDTLVNISTAKRLIGYEPKVSLKEGPAFKTQ